MSGSPATTQSYAGGVLGPGFGGGAQTWGNGQTPFGLNNWSPENPALGQYNELWNKNLGMQAYYNAANTPYQTTNPYLQQAMQGFGNASNAGALGLQALSGNQNAYNALANPYQQAVLQQMQNQFGLQNQAAMNYANDQAQGQNAFGGDRAQVMAGTALSGNQANQAYQMAGLQQQGFQNVMNQANQLAAFGQNANQGLYQGGQYANQQANEATQFPAQMLAAGFNSYPQMTVQGSNSQPSGASKGSSAVGTVAELAPLIAMFA